MAYDLTGILPNYKVSNLQFIIFETSQIIDLLEPIFANSLTIELSDGTPLVLNTDYELRVVDDDDMGMSEAKLIDILFNTRLVKSFHLLRPYITDYKIIISYQKLRSNLVDDAVREGVPAIYNPNLIAQMLTSIRFLESNSSSGSQIASTLNLVNIRATDLTGVDPNNLVTNELHTVDVPNNTQVIRPAYGSFYKHDIIVTQVTGNILLVDGVDYVVMGNDIPKTNMSSHSSGVYNYIYIIKSIVGDITIDYRVFGGEAQAEDYNNLKTAMVSFVQFLNNNTFITNQNLVDHGYIVDLNRRLFLLEDWQRLTSGALPKLTISVSHTDNTLQWYNIATLYNTQPPDGSIRTKDSALVRVKLRNHDDIFDVSIVINILNKTEPFSIKTIASASSNERISTTDYTALKESIVPMFRLLTVDVGGAGDLLHGAILQIGVSLRGSIFPLTEDLIIENLSSASSELYSVPTITGTILPNNDNITMPDPLITWLTTDVTNIAHQTVKVLGSDDGVLIWGGGLLLHNMRNTPLNINTIIDVNNFSPAQISKLLLVIHDRQTNKTIKVTTDQLDSYPMYHAMVYLLDSVVVSLNFIPSGEIVVTSYMGNSSSINERFILQQLYAVFN